MHFLMGKIMLLLPRVWVIVVSLPRVWVELIYLPILKDVDSLLSSTSSYITQSLKSLPEKDGTPLKSIGQKVSRLGRKKTCFKSLGRKYYQIGLKEYRLGKNTIFGKKILFHGLKSKLIGQKKTLLEIFGKKIFEKLPRLFF